MTASVVSLSPSGSPGVSFRTHSYYKMHCIGNAKIQLALQNGLHYSAGRNIKGYFMGITILMKKSVQLSLRVSDLVGRCLEVTEKKTHETRTQIIERCLIQCLAADPDCLQLIREYALQDPTLKALFDAATRGRVAPARKPAH